MSLLDKISAPDAIRLALLNPLQSLFALGPPLLSWQFLNPVTSR